MRRSLRHVNTVVHLAADTSVIDSIADSAKNLDVDVMGTFRLLMLMVRRASRSGVFQLGSGTGNTLIRLVEEVGTVVGPGFRPDVWHEPFRAGEIRHNWADVRKAREELGWVPRTSLPGGLECTWAWFRERMSASSPAR